MTRTSCLLFGLALLLIGQVVAGPVAAGNEERLFSVDFTDAPLEDVLRALFQDRPYTFTLGPGLEDLRVTIALSDVTFTHAVRAILALHDLTYARSGNVYRIVPDQPEVSYPIVRREPEPPYVRALARGPIIIYSRVPPGVERTEVVWRALRSPEEHVLYAARGRRHGILALLGYLPAPDGSCLLVWHSSGFRGRETTTWLAFGLPDGEEQKLGETPGYPWLSALSPFPYWEYWDDQYRLVLVPGSCVFTPDPGTLSGALPGPEIPVPEPSALSLPDARDRLTAYCEQHHQAAMEHLRSAFAKLADEMDVGYPGFEDPAVSPDLLLVSLGIPSAWCMGMEGWGIPMRHAACSPDGRLIAYADRWRHEGLPTPEGPAPTHYGWGARLDVFDVATGRRLWYARRASVPRWVPEVYKSVRYQIEWTHSYFADLRWSPDGRYLSFTTCDLPYYGFRSSHNVTVLDVAQWRPVLCLPNASNAFVITPPAAETAEHP